MTFDGKGNVLDGTAFGNTIAISGGQIVSDTFPFTFSGTYTVNPNGYGHVTFLANLLMERRRFRTLILSSLKFKDKRTNHRD